MSYYPPQHSYAQTPYPSTSHHGHGHGYQPSNGYYEQPASYGGQNVVYVPTHSSSHRSRRHRHGHEPTVISGTVVTSSGGRHRHHGHHGHGHRRPTIGERIRRFFGFGSRHYRYKSGESSWGFLGRSRRRKYVDARTGAEVDRHGRQVYRV
ncbi:hypothetical protein GGX14DRAFT_538838 [Mycena pura]|uniref:Uncharacterized protein n=1 Tax=Mycena pura TaxID=153505 RepID=A0AAD6YTA8_9AGAR|nr:hypothetical protein GGX14DRAFT_538838 [Mycena pura]